MRILIATGLYPPEIGGPAQYALGIADALQKQGHEISVVRYGMIKNFPSGIRHVLYACRLLFAAARKTDAMFALDTYSVGIPAALVCTLLRIPLLVRIGGDFLWEHYTNRTGNLVPLPHFYSGSIVLNSKERMIQRLTRWMLARATLAFNSQWLLDIWNEPYGIDPARAHIVENAFEPYSGGVEPTKKNFLFFSRVTALKNYEAFRRAFQQVQKEQPDILLEEGSISHEALLKKIEHCYAVVVPSVSDVAPNYVLDALRFGKPFILTKYSGYADRFKEYGVIIDPLDQHDMERGIRKLLQADDYGRFSMSIRTFGARHTYEDIAREFLALLRL